MTGKIYHHPIEHLLDTLWNAGRLPRIQIDATHRGVDVPQFVREKHGKRLVIDLDPSWPLNPVFGNDGMEIDLAFQGYTHRCVFPWTSIYVVLDKATGKGAVIETHLPAQDEETKEEPRKLQLVINKPEDWDDPDVKAVEVDRDSPTRKFGVIKGGKSD